MLKRTLPNWNDDRGVAKLAAAIIAERDAKARHYVDYGDRVADEFADEFFEFRRAEKAAVEAAQHGKRAPLTELLLGGHQEWLAPSTRELMAKILAGKRKAGPGRYKMTQEARWLKNPVHQAEVDNRLLRLRLRQRYPKQSSKAVADRAVELAASRAGIAPQRLQRHLDRSRNDRRRIK
jgi:hypothetical protein